MDGKAAAAAQLQQQLQQQQNEAEQKSWPRRLRGLLPFLAYLLVAVNFAHTTYRVRHDPHDLAFVAAAYAMLALLFFCLTKFETLTTADCPAESKTRERKSWPRRLCGLLPFLACLLVAVHFAHTTYGVLHDPHDLAFRAAAESQMRELLKLYMWAPSTELTAMLACRVSPMMLPPLNQIVWGLVFVVAAYAMLALLFYCLRKFETLTADSCAEIRERLKLPMWALSTALTAMFLCPPSPLNLLVSWVMALLVAIGGFFWLLFSDTWQFGNSLDKWNDEASEMEEKV